MLCEDRGFGDPDIITGTEGVGRLKKMGTEQPLGAVASDCIAYFFPGDKSDTVMGCFSVEKDKIRGMPCRIGTAVDGIKLAGVFQPFEAG